MSERQLVSTLNNICKCLSVCAVKVFALYELRIALTKRRHHFKLRAFFNCFAYELVKGEELALTVDTLSICETIFIVSHMVLFWSFK